MSISAAPNSIQKRTRFNLSPFTKDYRDLDSLKGAFNSFLLFEDAYAFPILSPSQVKGS